MRTLAGLLALRLLSASGQIFLGRRTSGFLSFADVAGSAYNVSFDERSLLVNGERSLFLSGSVHPPRGSQAMWEDWFEQAVENGLNMVQVYVFWNYHYPVEGQGYWEESGDLVKFVQRAGAYGLFVNLRIGPYVCAEWTYGGIPHWLGLKEGVAFRQTNAVWQQAMEEFFRDVAERMSQAGLFATQGGPIMLVQVENELQPTDEAYIKWSGDMAQRVLAELGAEVPLEMCNGEAANNTINTCNGKDCVDFLERNGQSGRILVDQPALWTENEQGFQVWGGAPPPGTENYFWGRSNADLAFSVLRWIARGGSHMNYYMWTGGNNYGHRNGASITTMYAVDAVVCPDGLPHEPKFSHTTAMHTALKRVAAEVMAHPAQLRAPQALQWFDSTSQQWKDGKDQLAFVYGSTAFVESNASVEVLTRVDNLNVTMPPFSMSILDLQSGQVLFNSASVSEPKRHRDVGEPIFQDWKWEAWPEPLLDTKDLPDSMAEAPVEQGDLSKGLTVYAFYETNVTLANSLSLAIKTTENVAFQVFIDGELVGTAEDHGGSRWNKTLTMELEARAPGRHLLTILSEDLGFPSYGFKERLTKGIDGRVPGSVMLGDEDLTNVGWRMRSGLAGEHFSAMAATNLTWTDTLEPSRPLVWYRSEFQVPTMAPKTSLLFNATGLGRGRLYVNGRDLGRYWNMPRNGPFHGRPTQQLYHIPTDWLKTTNELTLLEVEGAASLHTPFLVLATVEAGPGQVSDARAVEECRF